MKRQLVNRCAMGLCMLAAGLFAAGTRAAQTPIPLSCNFNGMVHNAGETGTANADDPNGFRSVSDRALDLAAVNGFGSTPIVGSRGLSYTIITTDHTLD